MAPTDSRHHPSIGGHHSFGFRGFFPLDPNNIRFQLPQSQSPEGFE
jgi:hypothetical protein